MGNILVTGGSKGIGKAVTHWMLGMSHKVVTLDRTGEVFEENRNHVAIRDDLGGPSIRDLTRRLHNEGIKLFDGILINSAVNDRVNSQWDVNTMRNHMQVNCNGHVEVFLELKKQGMIAGNCSIVVMHSILGDIGSDWAVAYAMSKAALKAFFKSYAMSVKGSRISVNYMMPGRVLTPGNPNGVYHPDQVTPIIADLLFDCEFTDQTFDLWERLYGVSDLS